MKILLRHSKIPGHHRILDEAGPVRNLAILLLLTADPRTTTPPLPELNAKVVAYARQSLGKVVGDGSCSTLAVEALREAGAVDRPTFEPDGEVAWGARIASFKEALPGDILQFRDAVFRGNRPLSRGRRTTWHHEYPHHTAIVSGVSAGGNVVTVLHQNVTIDAKPGEDLKAVLEGTLRMDSLQKGGWVRIYRPVAQARSARE